MAVEQIRRDRRSMGAVGGDFELLLALGANTVRAHPRLQPLLANAYVVLAQLLPVSERPQASFV
ncbi:MAG: hypothetical protein ABI389_13600 [Rhodanobacter sp.]